ncbi:MAG: SDR family oxidoreductase [Bacteroidales bacterium]
MKILLTGSNGLVGGGLIRLIDDESDGLICTARQKTAGNYPSFEYLDIRDTARMKYLLDLYEPDVLINAAAMSKPDVCEKHKTEAYQTNYQAVANMADACFERGIYLLHLSSDFVFDGTTGLYSEEDKPSPVNYYGNTKLMAENYLLQKPVKAGIVRTVLVYDSPQSSRANIVGWIVNSLKQHKQIQVVNDQFRTPTLVDDLAEGLIKLMTGKKEGIWHISGDEYLSVYDFACRTADAFNLNKKLISPTTSAQLAQPARRPPKTGFRITKAMRELNYHPHNIAQGLTVIKNRMDLSARSVNQ